MVPEARGRSRRDVHGVAATCYHGISTSRPRRRRDPSADIRAANVPHVFRVRPQVGTGRLGLGFLKILRLGRRRWLRRSATHGGRWRLVDAPPPAPQKRFGAAFTTPHACARSSYARCGKVRGPGQVSKALARKQGWFALAPNARSSVLSARFLYFRICCDCR